MSKLIFIRHAQASFMADDYDNLSEKGIEQSKLLGAYLAEKAIPFDKIYVGPLRRHHQTMKEVKDAYLKKGLEWKEPILLPELAEHQGTFILDYVLPDLLKTDAYIQAQHAELEKNPKQKKKYYLRMFTHAMQRYAKGTINHKEVQPWADFRSMVTRGIQQIIGENGSGMTIAAFTSGGTTAAATGHVLGMHDEGKIMRLNGIVKNTAMTEFLFSKGGISLKTFNETPHIENEKMITYV